MSNERLTREERLAMIRERASAVFLEKGYRDTTMEDIVAATGLSKGGLYHYYSNTSEILVDIMSWGNDTYATSNVLMRTIHNTSDREQLFELMLEAVLEKFLVITEPRRLYAMFCAEMLYDGDVRGAYKKLESDFFDMLGKATGQEIDRSREDVRFLSRMINTLLIGQYVLDDAQVFEQHRETFRAFFRPILHDIMKGGRIS